MATVEMETHHTTALNFQGESFTFSCKIHFFDVACMRSVIHRIRTTLSVRGVDKTRNMEHPGT